MTVLPFTARTTGADDTSRQAPPDGAVQVTGRFASPGGGQGVFAGTYRLERLLDQYGQLAAAGVFTGELTDAGGERIGLASRRHTAAVEVVDASSGRSVGLGPVDVNLLGFLVTVDAFAVPVRAPSRSPSTERAARPVRPTRELLGLVVDAAGAQDASGSGRYGRGG